MFGSIATLRSINGAISNNRHFGANNNSNRPRHSRKNVSLRHETELQNMGALLVVFLAESSIFSRSTRCFEF